MAKNSTESEPEILYPMPDAVNELDHQAAVEMAIENMPDNFIHCRKLGHSWHTFDVEYFPKEHVYEEKVRCSSCKGVKTLYMDEEGEYFDAVAYDMKAGYHTKGIGRMNSHDRAAIRTAAARRFINKKTDKKRQ